MRQKKDTHASFKIMLIVIVIVIVMMVKMIIITIMTMTRRLNLLPPVKRQALHRVIDHDRTDEANFHNACNGIPSRRKEGKGEEGGGGGGSET